MSAPAPAPAPGAPQAGLPDNVAALLCYLFGIIGGVIFLVLAPYNQNRTIRFHAWQSVLYSAAWFALWMGLSILSGALFFLPSGLMIAVISAGLGLLGLAGLVIWVILLVMAAQGKEYQLPVIGPYAARMADGR